MKNGTLAFRVAAMAVAAVGLVGGAVLVQYRQLQGRFGCDYYRLLVGWICRGRASGSLTGASDHARSRGGLELISFNTSVPLRSLQSREW